MEVLFRWIHLSDIHIGHGDTANGWNQRLVMDKLRQDIETQVKAQPGPPIDALFVTGDIANTGAGRSADEYTQAAKWLGEVAGITGVPLNRIFVVPGNHDVDRSADKAPLTKMLIMALRDGSKSLDDALKNDTERELLAERMRRYLAFTRQFAPVDDALFWTHCLTARSGLAVRIIGLNTAMLAADDTDKGKLRIGMTQIGQAFLDQKPGELVMVLGHHPLRGGWLADLADVEPWIKNNAHAVLTGHVHEADAEGTRSGSGGQCLQIVAGSVHGDRIPGVPAGHGYSFGAVVREGSIANVRITPRKWSEKNTAFRPDIDNIPADATFSEHDLPASIALPSVGVVDAKPVVETPNVKVVPGVPVSIFFSGSSEPRDVELRDALIKHMKPLKREGKATFTHAQQAPLGSERADWIEKQIGEARVILLLISKDYIGDDEYYEDQLLRAIERHQQGDARVIPILLRRYHISGEPFARLQALPRDNKPVDRQPAAEDEILADIAREIRVLVAGMRGEPLPRER